MFKGFRVLAVLLAVLLLAFTVVGCGSQDDPAGDDGTAGGTVLINGSTTVGPIGQAWAETFNAKHPEVEVVISASGSGDGIAALINGTADIAMASRKMKDSERESVIAKHGSDPVEFVVGRDGLAVIVNPDNPVEELTMEQIKGIFTGSITNWSQVGGPDQAILVYTRDTSSGTYGFFQEFVLDDEDYAADSRKTGSNAALAEAVAQEEAAVGYVGLAYLSDAVKAVGVSADGSPAVVPSFSTAASGEYPVVRDLNMYTIGDPTGLSKEFLEFGFSREGQEIVREVGYLPVIDLLEGSLQLNGSTTVGPVGQAWAEAFHAKHENVEVVVSASGSGDGIAALINGTADIAMASRKMKDSERESVVAKHGTDPVEFVVGRDGLAVIVNPDNPVEELTMEQIKGIFTGAITNWSQVGGPDQAILVYTRDTSSGTYGFFQEFVLDDEDYAADSRKTGSNAALAEAVAQEETAIGYVGLAYLSDAVKAVGVSADGKPAVVPSFETAASGEYPVVRDLNMYTIGQPTGLAKAFLDFGFSRVGQDIVKEVGYLPVK